MHMLCINASIPETMTLLNGGEKNQYKTKFDLMYRCISYFSTLPSSSKGKPLHRHETQSDCTNPPMVDSMIRGTASHLPIITPLLCNTMTHRWKSCKGYRKNQWPDLSGFPLLSTTN